MDALYALVDVCKRCVAATSSHHSENRDYIDRLKLAVVEALCKIEAACPKTEMCVMLHILLHVPDCIHRWNSVRNWWSFFGERCMGHFIRFIHNRDLAGENIMTAYVRHRLVMSAPPGVVAGLVSRLQAMKLDLPKRSMLLLERTRARRNLAGMYTVQLQPSRRNEKPILGDDKRAILTQASTVLRNAGFRLSSAVIVSEACTVKAMIKGVLINGRSFDQGAHVEYYPRVRRRGNQCGAGGRDGSSTSQCLATVNMYYVVRAPRANSRGRFDTATIVDITDIPILQRARGMYVVESVRSNTRLLGFNVGTTGRTFVHIDSIAFKIKLVPHWSDELKDALMCGLRVWEAR